MKLVRYGKAGQEKPGLIDKNGKQRSLLRSDVDPQDFANDLKALAS